MEPDPECILLGVIVAVRASQFRQMTPRRAFTAGQLQLAHADYFLPKVGEGTHKASPTLRHRTLAIELRVSIHSGLEFNLLSKQSARFFKVDGELMVRLAHCSTVRYAIIQVSSEKDNPERLVIAYVGEDRLRDLIAGSRIVETGFTSRSEATTKLVGTMSHPTALEQKRSRTAVSCQTREDNQPKTWYHFLKNHRMASTFYTLLSTINVVFYLEFYSTNLFSVALRRVLGLSS